MSSSFDPKICVIGGGFSGICAGIKLQEELDFRNYTIYEEQEDFGGIWLSHTYPGCACDVPSAMYSLSFELNPDWSSSFAKQPEIREYLQKVAKKHELYSRAKFSHRVESGTWNNDTRDWKVVVRDLQRNETKEIRYDIIIVGIGPYRNPNIPEMFLSFKGPMIHSAKWDSSVSLEDKVIGVVGSGASAVQIIPQIAPKAKKLVSFQRTPAWIPPQPLFTVPTLVQKLYRSIPFLMRLVRIVIFIFLDIFAYPAFKAQGITVDIATKMCDWNLNRSVKDPEKRAKLKPNFRFGCKRVTPSNTFYKTLGESHCEVVRSDISEVNSNSIVTADGTEYEIDVLILGTGYHIHEFWRPMEVKGKNNLDALSYILNNDCQHYLGVGSSQFPNSFLLLGPNTGYGHNSVVFSIECQMNWVVNVLKEMKRRNARYVQVTEEAEKSYRKMINEKTKGFVWGTTSCGSWYLDKNGTNVAIHPGNLTSFWNQTRNVDFDKLIIE